MRAILFSPWHRSALGVMALTLASPALAEGELPPICPTRPGLATPPCTVESGHLLAELGLADWTLDRQPGTRSDTVIAGDLLLRYGLGDRDEVQIGLTSFGTVRTRDATGISRASGMGDLTLAFKHSLTAPGGEGFSAALQPFLTLPTGGSAIGAGDWGGGLVVPMALTLSDTISLAFTPEIDAAVNAAGKGRHVALSAVEGVSFSLSSHVSTAVELQEVHDEDPTGTQDHALAGLSVAWQPASSWQLDMGTVIGLDRNSPGIELYVGIARRF